MMYVGQKIEKSFGYFFVLILEERQVWVDIKLSQEQITKIASSILISDVVTFVNKHQAYCVEFFNAEYENGNITKNELDYELEIIRKLVDANLYKE